MALAIPPGERRLDSRPPRVAISTAVKLSVVIVNFCQWRNTYRLVRELRRSDAARDGSVEIVVVDNASSDDPIVHRLRRIPGVRIEVNRSNEGFAAAVNRGALDAAGGWVLLLNPDVSVADGFLDEAFAAIDRAVLADPTTGVVGFRLLDSDGSPQASAGRFPTFFSTLAGLFRPRARRKCRHYPIDTRCRVEWVTGGCLLARLESFRELGGLDPQFFLYYEDVDFCQRMRAQDRSVWYDPAVAIVHRSPLHGRRVPAPLRLMTRHALLAYADRHWRPWQRFWLRKIIRLEAAIRRIRAGLTGDDAGLAVYRELERIARDAAGARERIAAAAELLRPMAASHDAPA